MTLALAGLAKVVCALQVAQATVAGTVRDAESGRPVEHALVALTDLDRSVSTDRLGRYTLPDVSPGPHHIAVRFIGYAPRTLPFPVGMRARITNSGQRASRSRSIAPICDEASKHLALS